MVIVSHDREFLDKVCNRIVDVEEVCLKSVLRLYIIF
jgi:ATPase subunit of ABC transporter with duplicated ATPase domains